MMITNRRSMISRYNRTHRPPITDQAHRVVFIERPDGTRVPFTMESWAPFAEQLRPLEDQTNADQPD